MNATPDINNYTDYIGLRRIEQSVQTVCRAHGIHGDLLANVPQVGTLDQQLTIVELSLHLPRNIRRHPVCEDMVRAAVLSHREHPRIARERKGAR